jgi:hypothetical protein
MKVSGQDCKMPHNVTTVYGTFAIECASPPVVGDTITFVVYYRRLPRMSASRTEVYHHSPVYLVDPPMLEEPYGITFEEVTVLGIS